MYSKNQPAEYRIVKKYSGFFSDWYYILEKKSWIKPLFSKRYFEWVKVAGNQLQTSVPSNWREVNIVEEITEEV